MKDSDDELEISQSKSSRSVDASNLSCQLLSLLPAPSKSISTVHSEINTAKPITPVVEVKDSQLSKPSFSLTYTETKHVSSFTAEIPKRNIDSVVGFSKLPIKPIIPQQSFLNNPLYESEVRISQITFMP